MDRHFLGAAVVAKLTAEMGSTDVDRVVTMSTTQGWDFNTAEVFAVSVDRGLATEEKMLCIMGNRNPDGSGTLQVLVDPNGHVYRGWDDTVIQRHMVGAKVEHIWSATDARDVWTAVRTLDARTQGTGTWRDLLPQQYTPIP